MLKCLLCRLQRGSKKLDCLVNGQPLAEVLRIHFPFIEILDEKVCQKCFKTVERFDQLYTIAKNNQEIGQNEDESTAAENFTERLFVSSLPQIQETELMDDQIKLEPSEEYLDDRFDALNVDRTQDQLDLSPTRRSRYLKSNTNQEIDQMVREHCEVRCEICETDFEAFSSLRAHCEKRHPEHRAVILCCGQRFLSRNGAVDHIRMQHVVRFTKCSDCEQLFRTMKALYAHQCSEHSSFRCWNCKKGFIKQQSLVRHVKLCELTGNKFECFVCKKDTFRSYHKLRIHLTHHRNQELEKKAGKMFVCDVCTFTSQSRSSFYTHRQVHEQKRAFEEDGTGFACEHCNKIFRSKPCIRQHVRLMHQGDLRQPCKICGKKVKFMDCHLMTHKNDPKACPTCGVTCKNKGVLKSHIRSAHKLEATLPCQFCNKLFKKRAQLTEHEATHTKTPLYFCDKCARSFHQRANYSTHMKKAHGIMSTAGLSASRKAGVT